MEAIYFDALDLKHDRYIEQTIAFLVDAFNYEITGDKFRRDAQLREAGIASGNYALERDANTIQAIYRGQEAAREIRRREEAMHFEQVYWHLRGKRVFGHYSEAVQS